MLCQMPYDMKPAVRLCIEAITRHHDQHNHACAITLTVNAVRAHIEAKAATFQDPIAAALCKAVG